MNTVEPKISTPLAAPVPEARTQATDDAPVSIRAADFSAWYGSFQALHGITLDQFVQTVLGDTGRKKPEKFDDLRQRLPPGLSG